MPTQRTSFIQNIPNTISATRGAAAVALLFTSFGTAPFWALYAWCGISDMIDGPLARRLNAESKRGAMIDSIADLQFVLAAAIVILPSLTIKPWIWWMIGAIAFTKLANIISSLVCLKRIVFPHTLANKLTGLLLFLSPIAITWIPLDYAAAVVITAALFASVQEGHFIRTGRIN